MADRPSKEPAHSVVNVIREVGSGAIDLVRSEVALARAEIKETTSHMGKYAVQAGIFGALLAVSIIPFLAFCVIGLGLLLGRNFWLSALIVAAVCAIVGGTMSYLTYRKIRSNLVFRHTRDSLLKQRDTVVEHSHELRDIMDTATGKVHDIRDVPQRRSSDERK